MKTRIILYGLAAMICAGAGSCARDTDSPGHDAGGDCYVSLAVMQGRDELTRANPADAKEFDNERKVNEIRMVLYDGEADNSVVKYVFDFKIRTKTGSDPSLYDWEDYSAEGKDLYEVDDQWPVTYARKVARADYRMLIVLNANTAVKSATAINQPLSRLKAAATLSPTLTDKAVGLIDENGHFLMTNIQGLVPVAGAMLRDNEQDANENPFEVWVGRAAARVTLVNQDPNYVDNPGDESASQPLITGLTWDLDITNRRTYYMRMPAPMADGQNETPIASSDYSKFYATDPNFSGTANLSQFFRYEDQYASSGYVTPGDLTLTAHRVYEDDTDQNLYAYAPENTMDASAAPGQATRVLIRCTYFPSSVKGEDGYFVFLDRLITVADITKYLADGFPTDLAAVEAPAREAVNAYGPDPATWTRSFQIGSLKYFYKGINYYAIQIEHFGNHGSDYGRYGVVRNNAYSVFLSQINGPGSPTVVIPDTDTSLEVNVKRWSIYDFDFNL